MLDARLRPLIDPPLNALGRVLADLGVTANAITSIGILLGIGAGALLAQGQFTLALVVIIVNRLLDGLDGPVARITGPTDFGGYLDIVADFVFYLAVPLGFGLAAPANLIPALVLACCFGLTGISFLAFAAIAGKRGMETSAHGKKSFFYNTGLAEGTETIVVFILFCLWPAHFPTIALTYASLCIVTVIQRTAAAWAAFKP
ncbi:CDP-alcohol phosphatidyltransferase family protein [Sandarakinorhabdus limnophila]|uniref:CDP-alcohol phosphatidyltransferase family protein n=1 Tax=Sandarakinorhabdus limnophila TaxID=210512 RepID=UPI00313777A4